MRNSRLYVLIVCAGLLARMSYQGALQGLNGEMGSWAALVTFWIPLIGVLWIGASLLLPVVKRWLHNRT